MNFNYLYLGFGVTALLVVSFLVTTRQNSYKHMKDSRDKIMRNIPYRSDTIPIEVCNLEYDHNYYNCIMSTSSEMLNDVANWNPGQAKTSPELPIRYRDIFGRKSPILSRQHVGGVTGNHFSEQNIESSCVTSDKCDETNGDQELRVLGSVDEMTSNSTHVGEWKENYESATFIAHLGSITIC